MNKDYWCEFECFYCHKRFRVLQKDVDAVIECPFCKTQPYAFAVKGTDHAIQY